MPREEIHVVGEQVDVRLRRTAPTAGAPVVFVPGLAAGPECFDVHPTRSLLARVADAGRTPWLVDFHVHWRRTGQDAAALLHALEQALAELRRHTGLDLDRIDAIGHSLGGILLLALAADGVPLRRIVTLASALDFRDGRSPLPRLLTLAPKGLDPLRLSVRTGGVPARRLAQVGAAAFGRGLPLPIELDQFHPGTTPGEVRREYVRRAVRDMPLALLLDLADLFTSGGLRLGPDDLPLRDAAHRIAQPVLLVAAVQDRQCPVRGVRAVAGDLPRSQLIEVGGDGAAGQGFGHVDVLTAPAAAGQVFDPVIAFLSEPA